MVNRIEIIHLYRSIKTIPPGGLQGRGSVFYFSVEECLSKLIQGKNFKYGLHIKLLLLVHPHQTKEIF